MDKCLKKDQAMYYNHCIIKEELIISDDEKNDGVHVKFEPNDERFVDDNVEKNKSNCRINLKKEFLGNSFLKSENADSNEQSKFSNNATIDEKPIATGKASRKSVNMDKLYKKYAKSYCHKCNVNKKVVIRRKARCPKCETQLIYSCGTCNMTYRDFTDLGYHLRRQHTSKIYPCPICQKTFAYKKGMVAHQRTQHGYVDESGAVVQQCVKCGKIFESKQLADHAKLCNTVASFKCDQCPFATTYQWSLKRHVSNKHTDSKSLFEKKLEGKCIDKDHRINLNNQK